MMNNNYFSKFRKKSLQWVIGCVFLYTSSRERNKNTQSKHDMKNQIKKNEIASRYETVAEIEKNKSAILDELNGHRRNGIADIKDIQQIIRDR